MAILNYSTKISSEKTIMEIQKILATHGATKITTDYESGLPVAVTFCLSLREKVIAFSLPANYSGVLKSMKNAPKIPKKFLTEEQALKVSWRIVKDWVNAQTALVEAELADMAEVFLPYAITKSGNTLYQEIDQTDILLLE